MNRKVRMPPGRRIVLAAALVIATVAVVEDAGVAAQAGNPGGARSTPAIVGTEISWNADIEYESALLVVVGRSENRTVKQITFGAREALRVDIARQGLTDGRYKYELLLYPPSNRAGGNQQVSVRSGVFFIRNGLPSTPEELEQRSRADAPPRRSGGH